MSRMFDPAELRRMGEAVRRAQDALASSSGLETARLAEQLAGGSTIRALQSAVDNLSALRLPDMFPAATALTDLASRTFAVHDSTAEVARQLGGSLGFGGVVDDAVATQHAMGRQLADMARAFDVSATVRQFTTDADVASRLLGPLNQGASPLIRLAECAFHAS